MRHNRPITGHEGNNPPGEPTSGASGQLNNGQYPTLKHTDDGDIPNLHLDEASNATARDGAINDGIESTASLRPMTASPETDFSERWDWASPASSEYFVHQSDDSEESFLEIRFPRLGPPRDSIDRAISSSGSEAGNRSMRRVVTRDQQRRATAREKARMRSAPNGKPLKGKQNKGWVPGFVKDIVKLLFG